MQAIKQLEWNNFMVLSLHRSSFLDDPWLEPYSDIIKRRKYLVEKRIGELNKMFRETLTSFAGELEGIQDF